LPAPFEEPILNAPDPPASPDDEASMPKVGDTLGDYAIVAPVARGAMAAVYEARDERTGETVALKVLHPLERTPDAQTRFRREFRHLSRLDHPNVLQVYEAGIHEQQLWYSMELIRGTDLKAEIEQLEELSNEARYARVEQILLQCARALAYIHERGLVHRDVKPANILIDGEGIVKLTDFGVVKDLPGEPTMTNAVIGTVEYMAPEQISGKAVDGRADLYGLGVVLYLMLTGRRPFSAHTAHGYLEMHLKSELRSPRSLQPVVPEHLDQICVRLLEKDPRNRFASATHLLHVLGEDLVENSDGRTGWPPRTIGRTVPKAVLRESLDEVATNTKGSALLITGPSGYGKSALLEIAKAWAQQLGLRGGMGRCQPAGSLYGAFDNLYQSLKENDESEVLRPIFENREIPADRYAVSVAFRDMLARSAPCVVVVDDLQHASPACSDLLVYLLRNLLELNATPILFVLGHSSVHSGIRPLLEPRACVRTLDLEPLERSEVEELVLSMLGDTDATRSLARRLHSDSGGSPSFVLDILKAMLDDGRIKEEDGRTRLNLDAAGVDASALPLPASLRQALTERIAPLGENALHLGRLLALARRGMSLDVLVDCTPLQEVEVMVGLDALVDARIVEEHRTVEEERVELSHERFRDVLLSGVDEALVKAHHLTMGTVMEQHYRMNIERVVEDLAWHFEVADVYTKAYTYHYRTASLHLRQSYYNKAITSLDHALDLEPRARPWLLLSKADTQLARVYLARGRALFHLGRLDDALGDFHEAEELAKKLDDNRLHSRVAGHLGILLRNMGSHQEDAERYLRTATVCAEAAGDETLLCQPMYHLGGVLWGQGDLQGAERCWNRTLAIATRVGDRRAQGLGWNGLGILALCRGKSLEARRFLERSTNTFEELGMLDRLVISRVNLIELYLQMGLLKKALTLSSETLSHAREVHHPHGVALAGAWRAQSLLALLRLEEALEEANKALAIVRRLDAREDELLCLVTILQIQLAQTNVPDAVATLDALEPLLERYDLEGISPQVRVYRGQVLAMMNQPDEARKLVDEVEATTEESGWPHMQTRRDLALGTTLRLLGEPERARNALQRALAISESNGYRYHQLLAHHELALVEGELTVRARHHRVATALSRSLSANLPSSEADNFLKQSWGGDPVEADK